MTTYRTHFTSKRLWIILGVSMAIMFSLLLLFGQQIYQEAPPIPSAVVEESGEVVFSRGDIHRGQNVWQALGGMQQGSIWGHGSYLAPDWSADWLRREAETLISIRNQEQLGIESSAKRLVVENNVRQELRTNRFDVASEYIIVTKARAQAIRQVADHYKDLFQGASPTALKLREQYGFPVHSKLNDADTHALSAFFFWTSWGAVTNRPNDDISYTSNWPYDPLVGNTPSASLYIWSFISILLLLGCIGALVWYYVRQFDIWRQDLEPEEGYAQTDQLGEAAVSPSMRATAKYFWLVTVLVAVQILLGILTAHYQVEGQGLYGLPFVDYLPYSVSRTWHTQLAVLWIATSWLAAGLYLAPLLSNYEPKYQRLGVNFLFVSLLIIVVGSFSGQWLAVHGFIADGTLNFWFGHQGYEYVDLGRFWQVYLFIGLLLWVVLVLRGLWPLFRAGTSSASLVLLVIVATISIGLLYGAGLMWGQNTHISIMEYWRWWVVHLWVEGVFEVFATAIIATVFVRMGILRTSVATVSVLFDDHLFVWWCIGDVPSPLF